MDIGQGSILALVRWSPAPWFAVAARPELLQHRDQGGRSRARLSIGMEAGEVPGLAVTAMFAVAIAALVLANFDYNPWGGCCS